MVCFRPMKRFVALYAAALALTACAASPIKVAQTVEQKAYATYGTYVIVQEQAVKMTTPSSTLPPAVKVQIVTAFKKAQPIVDTMMKGFTSYQQARADFEAQKVSDTTFAVAIKNLDSWVTQAQSVIAELVTAVKGAQQ